MCIMQIRLQDLVCSVLSVVKGVRLRNQLVNEDETKFEYYHCGTSPLSVASVYDTASLRNSCFSSSFKGPS